VSIKDEIQHVKAELSSDEKILESAFKLERVYKKYKYLIWGIVILLLLGYAGNAGWNAYRQGKIDSANDAFLSLQKEPTNSDALDKLKANNPKLYDLFELKQAMANKSVSKLEALKDSQDPIISAIAAYHAGVLNGKPVDSVYYHDMVLIEEAYQDLQAGKKSEAKNKLSLVPEDSPVAKIAQLMEHDTIGLK
jgi:hypothetical protein